MQQISHDLLSIRVTEIMYIKSPPVPGPSQNLTLTLNEPKKLTLTLPPVLIITLTLILAYSKPKIHHPQKNAWAHCPNWSSQRQGGGGEGGGAHDTSKELKFVMA